MGSAAIGAYADYQAAPEMAASIKAREAALLQNLAEETAEGGMKSEDQQELDEMLGVKDPLTLGSTLTETAQKLGQVPVETKLPVETETEVPAQAVPIGKQFLLPYGDGSQNYGYKFTGLDEEGVPQFMLLKLGSLQDLKMVPYSDEKDSTYQEALREYNKFIKKESE